MKISERQDMIARGEKPPPRTTYKLSLAVLAEALAFIERCAAAGERAPLHDTIPGGSHAAPILAERGHVLIALYGKHFPVIPTRTGANAGQAPWDPPRAATPQANSTTPPQDLGTRVTTAALARHPAGQASHGTALR